MGRFFQQPDKNNAEYFAVVQDLKQSTGRSILISIMAVSLVCFFTVVITLPFSWNFWMVMGLALSSGAASYILLHRPIWISLIQSALLRLKSAMAPISNKTVVGFTQDFDVGTDGKKKSRS